MKIVEKSEYDLLKEDVRLNINLEVGINELDSISMYKLGALFKHQKIKRDGNKLVINLENRYLSGNFNSTIKSIKTKLTQQLQKFKLETGAVIKYRLQRTKTRKDVIQAQINNISINGGKGTVRKLNNKFCELIVRDNQNNIMLYIREDENEVPNLKSILDGYPQVEKPILGKTIKEFSLELPTEKLISLLIYLESQIKE